MKNELEFLVPLIAPSFAYLLELDEDVRQVVVELDQC